MVNQPFEQRSISQLRQPPRPLIYILFVDNGAILSKDVQAGCSI